MKRETILICIIVIALLVIAFLLTRKPEVKDDRLETLYKTELQKNRNLEKIIIERDTLWSRIRARDKATHLADLKRSQHHDTIYKEIKPIDFRGTSDRFLDSLVGTIIGR